MVELSRSADVAKAPSAQKFKFCYIIRGLPGSGKSTVAARLAGATGIVLDLDSLVVKHSSADTSGEQQDSLVQIRDKHFAAFKAEVAKGTPVIVVDNNNIKEEEYIHFLLHAQQEHYIASIVTLPAPADLEIAAARSSKDVSVDELNGMLSMYEPTSLAKLSKKGSQMSLAAGKGISMDGLISPSGRD